MMYRIFLIVLTLLLFQCSSPSQSDAEAEFRMSGYSYSLEFIHLSHFGLDPQVPENSFRPAITFEIYLTDETDYTLITGVEISDREGNGWRFDSEEVQNSFNEENNSLIFKQLSLNRVDGLINNLFFFKFLDEEGTEIRRFGMQLDNEFPLPALTNTTYPDSDRIQIDIDFLQTPYDGGDIPFPVTIYNTVFESNRITLVWLDNNRSVITQENLSTDVLIQKTSSRYWYFTVQRDMIPENAAFYYTIFVKGRDTRGGKLFTSVNPLGL